MNGERVGVKELCFFPEPGSFIRLRGGDRIYDVARQITYRCGSCGQPVTSDAEMREHLEKHGAKSQ